MAEQKLGEVFVFSDHGSYKKNDSIKITIDRSTSANKIRVRKNGSEIFSGSSLSVESPSWFSQNSTGFKRISSGYRYTYPTQSSFPYHKEVRERIGADDPDDGGSAIVDDIKLTAYSITNVSGKYEFDGVVRVSAKGTNSPFLFSSFDPSGYGDEAMQKSGTFSVLPAGNYTLYARDARGYTDSVDVTIGVNTVDYGVKWRIQFVDSLGVTKRVDIEERDYSGSVTNPNGGASPYSFSARAEGLDLPAIGALASSLSIDIHTNTLDRFRELSLGDEKKYRVKQYADSGGFNLEFIGFIRPSTYSDVLGQPPYNTNVIAYDGLGTLKSLDFIHGEAPDEGINPRQIVKGDISHLQALKICLDKLNIGNGYRIACNIFSSGQDSSSGNTPLEQTYFDSFIYTKDDGTAVSSCGDVVKDILSVYRAFLISWEGYWYIVRQEELLSSTVNYVEFDSEINQVTTGSWSPFIEFNRPEDSGGFRWQGAQPRRFTKTYKKVVMTPNVTASKNTITEEFSGANIVVRDGQNIKFSGFDLGLYNEGSRSSIYLRDNKYVWDLSIPNGKGSEADSKTYIKHEGRIEYASTDWIKINAKFDIVKRWLTTIGGRPDHYIFKWSLRVGNRWATRDGQWVASSAINEEFISGDQNDFQLDQEIKFTTNPSSSESYSLKIYGISLAENTAAVPFLQDDGRNVSERVSLLSTKNYPEGSKVVIAREGANETTLYYYKLTNSNEVSLGTSTVRSSQFSDTNTVVWKLQGTYRYFLDLGGSNSDHYAGSRFEDVSLEFLQDGQSVSFRPRSTRVANKENGNILNVEMNQFDLDFEGVSNLEKSIKNYMRLSNGSPTGQWLKSSGGVRKSIQQHQLDWLVNIGQKTRVVINGKIKGKEQITPLNVLRDSGDNNRIYALSGISVTKDQEVTGQMLEISSDDQAGSSYSAFTTGIQQNAVT